MTAQINLLPTDRSGNKSTEKAAKIANKLALTVTATFLIIALIGGATYFLLFRNLTQLKSDREAVVTSIQNLQGTEASLVLLKDRLQKSEAMLGSRVNEDAFAKQKGVFDANPENVTITGSQIDAGKSTLEVSILGSQSLSSLLTTLLTRSDLSSLVIDELSFSLVSGFDVQFEIF